MFKLKLTIPLDLSEKTWMISHVQFVPADAVQQPCGHPHCRDCLTKWHTGKAHHLCPLNRKAGAVTDCAFVSNKVRGLTVSCAFQPRGCKHTGTLGLVTSVHEPTDCKFRHESCPHCEKPTLFNQLRTHAVMKKCLECDSNFPSCLLIGHSCAKCPNFARGCLAVVDDTKLESHLDICPKQFIGCCFSNIGCEQKIERDSVEAHEANVGLHFRKLHLRVMESKRELDETKSNLSEANTTIAVLRAHIIGVKNDSGFPRVLIFQQLAVVPNQCIVDQSSADSVSVWAQLKIPHGIDEQFINQYSECFPAFGRRLRLNLFRNNGHNTLYLCLNIDPAEAISAVAATYSFSACAYNPQSFLIPAATALNSGVHRVYGNEAPARIFHLEILSSIAAPVSPMSHRAIFSLDQMVVHYIITKH